MNGLKLIEKKKILKKRNKKPNVAAVTAPSKISGRLNFGCGGRI